MIAVGLTKESDQSYSAALSHLFLVYSLIPNTFSRRATGRSAPPIRHHGEHTPYARGSRFPPTATSRHIHAERTAFPTHPNFFFMWGRDTLRRLFSSIWQFSAPRPSTACSSLVVSFRQCASSLALHRNVACVAPYTHTKFLTNPGHPHHSNQSLLPFPRFGKNQKHFYFDSRP
jgi:hypothetical protein